MSKYELGIYEYYNPSLHGTCQNMVGTLLVYSLFSTNEFYYNYDEILDELNFITHIYNDDTMFSVHQYNPFISNYRYIRNIFNLEIIETKLLNNGALVCINKTCYLKFLQRKWKTYYKKLKIKIKTIKTNLKFLMHREMTGKFPIIKYY
tara:strand:- start:249 stop:695 length:447 start_codon:yes stop_codon:yes gene_type:complete